MSLFAWKPHSTNSNIALLRTPVWLLLRVEEPGKGHRSFLLARKILGLESREATSNILM